MNFYDAAAAGTCLWSNSSATCASATATSITLTNGLFSENLGATGDGYAAIGDSVFADNAGVYLQVTIEGETLTPRKLISAAPYALNADTLDGIDSAGLMTTTGDSAAGAYDFTGAAAEVFSITRTLTNATDENGVLVSVTASDTTSGTTAQYGLVVQNAASTEGLDALTLLSNVDTDDLVDVGLLVTSVAGGITTGIDLSDSDIVTAIDVDANFMLFDGIRVFEGATGTLTWEDTSGNDLMVLTDGGTTGTLALGSGDITCTDCLDFTDLDDTLELDTGTTITGEAGELLAISRTLTDATDESGVFIGVTASDTTSGSTAQYGLNVLNQASTEGLDEIIHVRNVDTDDAVPIGISVSSASGGIDTGIDISDVTVTTAIDIGDNFFLHDGIRAFEGSLGTLTWEDTSGNDLMVLTDDGTTGTLALGSGDITCTDCLDFSDLSDTLVLDAATSITMDGTEVLTFSNSGTGSSLLVDQDGSTGTTVSDVAGGALHISNTGNDNFGLTVYSNNASAASTLVQFENDNASSNDRVLQIQNDGTGAALDIDQNGDGSAISIASDATSVPALAVVSDAQTTGDTVYIQSHGLTTGNAFVVGSSGDDRTSGHLVDIQAAGTDITTGTISGSLLNVNHSITNNSGGLMTLSGPIINVQNNPTNTSGTLTDTQNLIFLNQDNTTGTGDVLSIDAEGTGSAILVSQGGDTGATVDDTAGGAIHLSNTGNADFGLTVYSNQTTSTSDLVLFHAANASFDNDVVTITNDSTIAGSSALLITQTGGGSAEALDIDANTGDFAVDIFNDGNADTQQGVAIQACLDLNPTTACNFIEFRDGDGGVLGAVEGDGAGGVTNASAGSDYAELFPGNYASFAQGDVIAINASGDVVLATSAHKVIGAFSVAPNTLGNWFDNWRIAGTHVPVALLGQVPVNVTMEGGAIVAGDYLTLSSTSGKAMKANGAGYVLGRALASASTDGQIMVFIQPKWQAIGVLSDAGSRTLVSEGLVLAETADATAGTPGQSSHSLSFRGSGWDGATAVYREMLVQNDVTDAGQYKLSVTNNDGTEVAFVTNEGDLALSGKLYPSDRGTLQTDKYIFYDGSAGPGGDFMRTNASGWGSGSYDFAEMFPSQQVLSPGEVVIFSSGKEEVARSTGRQFDPKIAGIVSTQPGFLAGENIPGHVPVALAGRVPTFVTNEGGSIHAGDPLTTSSRPGYAMKATEQGPIVGYAMESLSETTGVITVFVRPSFYDGQPISDAPATENVLSGLQGSISNFDATGVLDVNGGALINASSIAGPGGLWEIRYDGEFRTKNRYVQLVVSSQNELVETYATMSVQTTVELSGTAQLTNGRARIKFEDIDPTFNDIIDLASPFRVFLTADRPTNSLYAVERDQEGFVILEAGGGGNAVVDWMVIAYQRGYAPEEDASVQGQDTIVHDNPNLPPGEQPDSGDVADTGVEVPEDPIEEGVDQVPPDNQETEVAEESGEEVIEDPPPEEPEETDPAPIQDPPEDAELTEETAA